MISSAHSPWETDPLYPKKFSHIYVEEAVWDDPVTKKILAVFPDAEKVPIMHYKDVFNRRRQNVSLQHKCQNLILAKRSGSAVFPGAPVCQSFGNEHFYYCSSVMNCLCNCSYCYLKGMYPSGNLVIFVNLSDIFAEVEALLAKFPVYLCVSYDTDLVPLEDLIGYVDRWCRFVREHENLSIEIRTKCGRTGLYEKLPKTDRVIFAFTLSPEKIAESYEKGAGTLSQRLQAARSAQEAGFPIRLCFDPMLYIPGWEGMYAAMLDEAAAAIDLATVLDFSVGTFRISDEYLKSMRRQERENALVWYPFARKDGYCQYPTELAGRMESFLAGRLREMCEGAKIFFWEGGTA